MRWRTGRRSANLEDRRATRISRRGIAGGGIGTVIVVLVALYLGVDPAVILQGLPPGEMSPSSGGQYQPSPREQELADFTSVILADTEDTWHELFRRSGEQYQEPGLVLFSGAVQSACGMAAAAVGPFYCPADQKVYIDLSFFEDLASRFRAPGDFAQAYVIAHEVGHHVQTLLGISNKVRSMQQSASHKDANAVQVRMELQADCFAGVWANNANKARQILEQGDIEEGLTAASAIGDDRIQKQTQGHVVPDAF
ncbi:MAG: flagellar biosynthesis protein FlgM, partial [Lysobacterales bacterium]